VESPHHIFTGNSEEKPFVSVICPIRNEEDYISQCMESLINQTYDSHNMEILVVDGMSDDGTRDIVGSYQKKFDNIKLIDNQQRIVPIAMNLGIKMARGKYILRMDGHAKAMPNYIEKCIESLEKYDAEGVGGPIMSVNDTDSGKAIALAMSSPFGVGNSAFRVSTKRKYVDTLAFPAYRREVFEKYGYFDEELVRCQDDEFNFRIRKHGGKILLMPEIQSFYYPRGNFKSLWKQYFGYGFWKIRVLQKYFWMMQIRHFVPASFVASLIVMVLVSFVYPLSLWLFLFVLMLYVMVSLLAAFNIWFRNKEVPIQKILLSFYLLHFGYGSGFLWGLVRFTPRWFNRNGTP
jgi:glycosyltransferase involved in cell wall biosynthesis